MTRVRVVLATVVLVALPAVAHACAVCGFGEGRGRDAFFWTMVLLSLLPLAMFGAGLMFLRHAARERTAAGAVSADAPGRGSSEALPSSNAT